MIVDQAQTRRALAVVTFTLRQVIPSAEEKSTFSYADTLPDRITCLRSGFAAFGKIVEAIDAGERADLLVVGVHLFGDLLRDENPKDVVGGCLPVLKTLVDGVILADKEKGGKVVHGLISAVLTNVDDMR